MLCVCYIAIGFNLGRTHTKFKICPKIFILDHLHKKSLQINPWYPIKNILVHPFCPNNKKKNLLTKQKIQTQPNTNLIYSIVPRITIITYRQTKINNKINLTISLNKKYTKQSQILILPISAFHSVFSFPSPLFTKV